MSQNTTLPDNPRQNRSYAIYGGVCPLCGKVFTVRHSFRVGNSIVSYLACRRQRGGCGYFPPNNKVVSKSILGTHRQSGKAPLPGTPGRGLG